MSREMKHSGIEWIGEIPKEWKVLPHKYIMSKKKEIQEHYSGQDIISLTMNGVIVRDLDAGGKMPLTFDGYQIVYPNNLLLCLFDIDVTPRCVGLIKNYGVTSPAYSQFVVKEEGYPPYYDYLLRYMDDNKCLLHLSKNLRSSLTETDFGQIQTCLPPLSEQQKIADYLDKVCGEVDEMIALQEQMIEELKAYKQSVITEAVTKGLNPDVPMKNSGIDWIGEVPEGWRIISLQSLSESIRNGYVGPTRDLFKDEGIRYIQSLHLKDGVIDFDRHHYYVSEEWANQHPKIHKDDLLIVQTGDIGQVAIVPKEYDDCNCHALIIVVLNQKLCLPTYISYFLRSSVGKELLLRCKTGALLPHLNSGKIGVTPITLPSIDEQQSIASYLDTKCSEIDALIAIKQAKIEELKDYKKSVIYEYVTGKKEVGGDLG